MFNHFRPKRPLSLEPRNNNPIAKRACDSAYDYYCEMYSTYLDWRSLNYIEKEEKAEINALRYLSAYIQTSLPS